MRRLLFVTAIALGANVAQANNGLFYFGAGITRNNVSPVAVQNFANLSPNISSTSWQVFAGIRPISLFAVEADYLDLGSTATTYSTPQTCVSGGACSTTLKADAKAFAGYAIGFLPIPVPNLDVYGKVGLAHYEVNSSVTAYAISGAPYFSANSDNSNVITWGAGVQAHVGIIGGRLEYEGFNKASTSVFSLSVFLNLK